MLKNGKSLTHCTLLFEADLEMMERILTPETGKLARNGVASVRQRVMNLKELLPEWTMDQFIEALVQLLPSRYQAEATATTALRRYPEKL